MREMRALPNGAPHRDAIAIPSRVPDGPAARHLRSRAGLHAPTLSVHRTGASEPDRALGMRQAMVCLHDSK